MRTAVWASLVVVIAGCSSGGGGTDGSGLAAEPPITPSHFTESTICGSALTDAQQNDIDVWKATPVVGDGEVSCYYSMTPGGGSGEADYVKAAGYSVFLFEDEEALQQDVDSTEGGPARPMPVTVSNRPSARQVAFGERWSATFTVEIGQGAFLFVERYGPGHSVPEKNLVAEARTVTEMVLANLARAS